MKLYGVLLYFLLIFVSACAAPVSPPQEDGVVSASAPQEVDKSCAYFYFLWGRSAERERHFPEAVEAYEKALVCGESSRELIRRLVLSLKGADRRAEALEIINQHASGDFTDIDEEIFWARLYGSIAEDEEARRLSLDVLAKDSANKEALIMLASLDIRAGNSDAAIKTLEDLARLHPKYQKAWILLAKMYASEKMGEKAKEAYGRALSLKWSTPLALEAASISSKYGDPQEAERLYKKVLAEDYQEDSAAGSLVDLYVRMGEDDKAMALLKEMRQSALEPRRVDMAIGRLLLKDKRYQEAAEHYESMLHLYPELAALKPILALAYYEGGKIEKAKELLRGVSKESEAYEDSLLLLVDILHNEKGYEEAINLLSEALKGAERDNPTFYTLLGELYETTGSNDSALKVYRRALKKFPDEVRIHLKYATLMGVLGDEDGAMAQMTKVLLLDPDNAYALNYLGYTWAEKGINLDKALEYITKAVSISPDDGFIRDSLGWVYFMRGNYSGAVQELRRAVALIPQDPTVLEHLADALARTGGAQEASDLYKKALKILGDGDDKGRIESKIRALEGGG